MNIDFDIKCTTGGFALEYPVNECLQNLLGGGGGGGSGTGCSSILFHNDLNTTATTDNCEINAFGQGLIQINGDNTNTMTTSLAPGDCYSQYISYNTAIGDWEIASRTGSSAGLTNVHLGCDAMNSGVGVSGSLNNTAIGQLSLTALVGGNNNTAVGQNSLNANTTGNRNTAVGMNSLAIYTGNDNTCIGHESLFSSTSGINTALGKSSLRSNTTGNFNTAGGFESLLSNTIGNNNTAFGHQTLRAHSGIFCTAIGAFALLNNTGNDNTGIGANALTNNLGGVNNTAVGNNAMFANTTADNCTAVGDNALDANTVGIQNTAIGTNAMSDNVSGITNTAVGMNALFNNVFGSFNTVVGGGAMASCAVVVERNVAIGHQALQFCQTDDNTAVGRSCIGGGGMTAAAVENVGLGRQVMFDGGAGLTSGERNTGIGTYALFSLTSGSRNTAVGRFSASLLTTGSDNIHLGVNTTSGAADAFSLVIGNSTTSAGSGTTVIAPAYVRMVAPGALAVQPTPPAGFVHVCYNPATGELIHI
jgi:hypothetical protein